MEVDNFLIAFKMWMEMWETRVEICWSL